LMHEQIVDLLTKLLSKIHFEFFWKATNI
jgi:hypothetical protein